MLDYISNQLKARMGTPDPATDSETQMNEAVLEYAHLFQELDDLSMKGTSAGSSRPYTKIDIPLEDDIEIDSVELNLLDGRVTNVPMDATVQEAELALEYAGMKTYEQIYMETYSHMSQHMRETDAAYKERVTEAAQKAYQEYQAYIVQEGLFGFDKIDINDPRVPERLIVDFGEHPERGTYYVKIPVLFQVDKKHRILKKQLETSQIIQNHRDIGVALRQYLFNTRKDEFGFEKPYDIWDKLTPLRVVITVEPKDQYFAGWVFEVEGSDKKIVIEWSMPIKSKFSHNVTDQKLLRTADSDFEKLNAITKRQGIQEMAVPTKAPSRFFQEAIDFGNPDEAPAGDASAPDVSVDAAPPADGQAQDAGTDTTAGADVTMTDDSGADANTEAIETNDVSDQIAEKVADDTKKDATDSNDVNIDDLMDENNGDADMTDASADQPTDDEISADLGEDTASTEDTATDTSNLDFDNMTIDELLAQGTEKLKGMTIQQLKDFMTSGDTGAELSEEEVAQEAFFLTRGNIGKELDIHLRKTMGVLNDSDKDLNEICSEFRKEGKKLNRVVHKAAGMKKVFNDDERKHMARLNHVLVDLMAIMRGEIEESATSTVKRLIQAFVSEATAVAQIIESKNPKPVQEAASLTNDEVKDYAMNYVLKNVDSKLASVLKNDGELSFINSSRSTIKFEKNIISFGDSNVKYEDNFTKRLCELKFYPGILKAYGSAIKFSYASIAEFNDALRGNCCEYFPIAVNKPMRVNDNANDDCPNMFIAYDLKRKAYVIAELDLNDDRRYSAVICKTFDELQKLFKSNKPIPVTNQREDTNYTRRTHEPFVYVSEGFFDIFKKKPTATPAPTPVNDNDALNSKMKFVETIINYAWNKMPDDLKNDINNWKEPILYSMPASELGPLPAGVEIELSLSDWGEYYKDSIRENPEYAADSFEEMIEKFNKNPKNIVQLGTVNDPATDDGGWVMFDLNSGRVVLSVWVNDANSILGSKILTHICANSWTEFKNKLTEIVESKNPKPVQEAFFETSSKSKRSKEESFRGLNDDRLKLLKKKGLFGKIFGKKDEPTAKKSEPRSDGLPESFPITADKLNKILKIIEDKTKKPCSRILTQKDHVSPDEVKPTSSVRGGIPPFIGEIPTDNEGKQLRFVVQINFADVSGVPGLPSDGIMQFWLDRHMDLSVRDPDRKEGKHYIISNKKYRVLYYSPEDMKTKDRTTELRDQIDMSIYEDSESERCFGKLTDVALLGFNKTENCLSMFSFDEIDNYEVLFMDTWNDVISDPENTIKDVKEVYGILKQIPKGFSDQRDGKGLFDNFGWKIGGYPGFVQFDFRKYDYDTKFTSDNTFLLLQMDSGAPIMWGDCGTGQIFITKEALSKCDFSKAVFDWACY